MVHVIASKEIHHIIFFHITKKECWPRNLAYPCISLHILACPCMSLHILPCPCILTAANNLKSFGTEHDALLSFQAQLDLLSEWAKQRQHIRLSLQLTCV